MTHSFSTHAAKPSAPTTVWQAGLMAAVASSLVNAVIYGLARMLNAIPQSIEANSPLGKGPITLGAIVSSTLLAVIAATLVFAVLRKITDRHARVFRIVALAALILSLASPFSIPDVTAGMAISLVLMHVATALVTVGSFDLVGRN